MLCAHTGEDLFEVAPQMLSVSLCQHGYQPTALLIAASMDALGMFLLLHCSSMWAKFRFSSGLDPPSGDDNQKWNFIQSETVKQWNSNYKKKKTSSRTFDSYSYHHTKLHKHSPPRLIFWSLDVLHLWPLVMSGTQSGAQLQCTGRRSPPPRGQHTWRRRENWLQRREPAGSRGHRGAKSPQQQQHRSRHALHTRTDTQLQWMLLLHMWRKDYV